MVDWIPIRTYRNHADKGVAYPRWQPMGIKISLWNGDSWATRGGKDKIDWSKGPFIASFRNYTIDACVWKGNARFCRGDSSTNWWNKERLSSLTSTQRRWFKWSALLKDRYIPGKAISQSEFPSRSLVLGNHWFSTDIQRLPGTTRRSININNSCKMQHLLGNPGSHDTGTTWGWHHPHRHATTLSGHLARHGVRQADLVSPVSSPDRNHRKLSQYKGTANSGGHLLGALDTETDMAVSVANDEKGLETGPLVGINALIEKFESSSVLKNSW
ncbi:hypothetical protein EZV62_011021 [Acer yangbiense]|uniref:GH16 domain-containing protein n=1 Tax=Acer yangbiense TaxID=1000413 RepID=A0A5C7I434_9ROSI|nr:hypothetical protein EZV62_011021 [Acer yangbiense]